MYRSDLGKTWEENSRLRQATNAATRKISEDMTADAQRKGQVVKLEAKPVDQEK